MPRPNKGWAHVDATKGGEQAKQRVRWILATISGEVTVNAACAEIGVGPTHFGNLRLRMLQGAVSAMEPLPIGRPRLLPKRAAARDDLEDEIFELEHENTMLRAKLEVNEALRAGRAAKSAGKAKARKGPRRRR